MPAILKEVPNTVCIIAGDGDHLPVLRQRASELGIQEQVRFTGGLSRAELSEYFAVCDVFVLPSQYYESFGLVYLEAAACGKTAIAGNRGGTSEAVVDNTTGYLVDPFCRNTLTSKVITLLQDEQLRNNLASSAYQRALAGFSNTAMAEKIVRIEA